MKKYKINTKSKQILADIITPVSIYLKIRDIYPNSILLESSDYHGGENSFSFICLQPTATFMVEDNMITEESPSGEIRKEEVTKENNVPEQLNKFINSFDVSQEGTLTDINGLFGYSSYDAVQYFDTLKIQAAKNDDYKIPDIRYSFYKYIIAINHHKNNLQIIENLFEGETSKIDSIESLLSNRNFATYSFETKEEETSNITDEEYMSMVTKGKEHCYRGDVYQSVISRQFAQKFSGDDFNVYRTLRSINPSPYLFYFDYGDYKIFGSSPEAQLIIKDRKAIINPIAGTFKRTGNDEEDKQSAIELSKDKKENAEHVMLVDLARNDLSRNASQIKVENYREIQFYSHVIHMVSKVSGILPEDANTIKVMGDSFPAGTLSGAPKYKAMELINKYENQNRSYYGGCIGHLGFNGDFNQAIMIRSFLSKNNTLFYQAGAGVVSRSKEESELKEVNNKLAALKNAITLAKEV